jgi:hypothetical protein
MRPALAQITKTDNGYSLKYPEAVQRDHPVPSSIMGMDDGQIEVMVQMQLVGTEDEGWNNEQREERADRARKKLREVRERFSSQTRKVWMIEMREWQMPTIHGVLKALEAADKAHDQLVTLIRSGVQFVGPLQPIAVMTPGPAVF